MQIDFLSLKYKFQNKPLLIGGKAMEYYNLRKAGNDIDFVITKSDWDNLAKQYPQNIEDLFGDLGIKVDCFELWTSILLFDYEFLSEKAVEQNDCRIITLEKLLFLKTMAAFNQYDPKVHEKSRQDVKLLVKKMFEQQYGKENLEE